MFSLDGKIVKLGWDLLLNFEMYSSYYKENAGSYMFNVILLFIWVLL